MKTYDNSSEKDVKKVYPEIRVYLLKEFRFFGKGPYELLQRIDQEGSLKAACDKMNISYSKSLRMIKNIESQLGLQIVDSKRGGRERGQSELTEIGKKLISLYTAFLADCDRAVVKLFNTYFSDWLEELYG